MAKALTKSQIAASLAETSGLTKKQSVEIFEVIAQLAYKNAKNSFTFPGLGKLVLVNRKARMGRNPATGESIKIPAKKVVKFRIAKAAAGQGSRVATRVSILEKEARREEIARMLAGAMITDEARAAAARLLECAHETGRLPVQCSDSICSGQSRSPASRCNSGLVKPMVFRCAALRPWRTFWTRWTSCRLLIGPAARPGLAASRTPTR